MPQVVVVGCITEAIDFLAEAAGLSAAERRTNAEPLRDVDAWLDNFRAFWTPHLDALATEIARGRRQRRLRAERSSP